jgi:hypothetical protein
MCSSFPDRQKPKWPQMDNSERDRSAAQVLDLLCSFEVALSESKRKHPVQEFFSFANAARRYIDLTRRDQLVRRDVAVALKGLAQSLEARRKRVPEGVLRQACTGVEMAVPVVSA